MNQDLGNKRFDASSWTEIESPWKSHFLIQDNGDFVLKGNALRNEKICNHVQPENWEQEITPLVEAFTKIQEIATDTQQKWEQASDKLSVKDDIHLAKKLIKNMPALGDYDPIIAQFENYQQEIQAIHAANAIERKKIVDEAVSIMDSDKWSETTEKYKQLIDAWKSAPQVSGPDYEKLWNQLSEAKDKFFERKRLHYEELEKEQMINWDRKLELCEKAESLQDSSDWKATTEQFNALLEEWKTIGIVPSAEKNESLWQKFNAARKHFFDRKNEHSSAIKTEQEQNFQLKNAILAEAEILANSTDWKQTSQRLETLQQEWEKIGKVPIEHADDMWFRWKKARDTFYEAKRQHAQAFRNTLQENYDRKKVLVERAEHLSKSEQWRQTTDELMEMMTEWKTIGPVPKEYGDELWNRFNEARRLFFKRKDDDRDKRKEQFEARAKARISQTHQFLYTLQQEQKDEQAQLEEFKTSIENTDGSSKKDAELKAHLTQLIQKLEKSIEKRKEKIIEVESQLKSLE